MRFPPALPLLLRSLAVTCVTLLSVAFAVSPAAPPQRDRTAELGPEVVEKRAELNKKVRAALGEHWGTIMTAEIARIGDAAQLTDAQRKDLEAPAKEAVAAAIEEWIRWGQSNWEKYFPDSKEDALAMLSQAIEMVEVTARRDFSGNYTPPQEQPKWHEALKRVLTEEQWSRWEDLRKKREAEIDKIIDGELRGSLEQMRHAADEHFGKQLQTMRAPLQLTPERVSELDRALKKLVADLVDGQLKQLRTVLRALDQDSLQGFVRGAGRQRGMGSLEMMMGGEPPELKLEQLFTEEERQTLRQKTDGNRAERTHALGRIFVAVMDDEVALTAPQREKLIPLAEAVVKTRNELYPGLERQEYYQISLSKLLAAGKDVPEEELAKVLDPTQLRRWQDASAGKGVNSRRRNPFINLNQAQPISATPKPDPEPESVEMAISDSLYERSQNERRRLLALSLLKAEDAARISGISKELGQRLTTAARGAADAELERWKTDFEQNVRSQLRDVSPENVRQRLAAMDRNLFIRSSQGEDAKESLLDAALKRTLTEAQRKAWDGELAARQAFRQSAVAALIMTDFAADVPLTAAAREKLQPMLLNAVNTYERDIASMFSYYDTEWFLQSNSLFVPFAALPEAELKSLLGDKVWEEWSKGPRFANSQNYWENIQRIHANRTRIQKEREDRLRKQKP